MRTGSVTSHRDHAVATAMCAAWLLAVALTVLWPTPVDHAGGGSLRRLLAFLHEHGLPAFVSYGAVEFIANMLMFAPFGLFWFILAPHSWRWTGPLVGFGLSVFIEMTQLMLLPQRFATRHDVLANTLGAVCGTITAWLLASAQHQYCTM